MWSRSRPPRPRTESASPALTRSVAARAPLDEVRRWMANRHLEAVYVTRPVSIAYLTGFHADPHERLMALAVRHDGATLIVPALEGQSAAEHASNAAVVAWRDGEDPYELVDRALAGLTEIGVEKDHLSLLSAEVITSRTGVSELVDVGTEIVRLRLIKHEAAIEKLARAAVLWPQQAAVAAVRPGATTGDVHAAARRSIDAAGYGERFFHRVGHGLGLEIHEAPSLDPGSQTVLEPGMVFTIEPGVYIPGFGGVRIEDDVVVEDGGCRVLTKADRSLRVITHT